MTNSQRWVSDARKITYPRAFTIAIPTRWNHGKLGLRNIKLNVTFDFFRIGAFMI